MACRTIMSFIFIDICSFSAEWLSNRHQRGENLLYLVGPDKGGDCCFHRLTCGSLVPDCTCSLGLRVSTERSLSLPTATLWPPEAPAAGLQPLSTLLLAGHQLHERKRKCRVPRRHRRKEPQWTPATPASPVAVSRFACHGQCICHSVSTRWSGASLALASVKSFISLFISGLGSHLSLGRRPPSIIPMGEKVGKGKYILI